jgi:hypothetical protein
MFFSKLHRVDNRSLFRDIKKKIIIIIIIIMNQESRRGWEPISGGLDGVTRADINR